MNQKSWIFKNIQLGAFLGVLSIILGAFAAHQLDKIADFKVVQSFKTGVQYQFLQSFFALIVAVMGGLGWLNQKQSKISTEKENSKSFWDNSLAVFFFTPIVFLFLTEIALPCPLPLVLPFGYSDRQLRAKLFPLTSRKKHTLG